MPNESDQSNKWEWVKWTEAHSIILWESKETDDSIIARTQLLLSEVQQARKDVSKYSELCQQNQTPGIVRNAKGTKVLLPVDR